MDKYQNWKEFIFAILTNKNQFELDKSFKKGDTDIQVYRQKTGDAQTTLAVGYLSGDRLIYLNVYNDKTPGFNKSQTDYYNENDFAQNEAYGNPGLEFNKVNREGILNDLRQGYAGREILFYNNGKLSHSKVTIAYDQEKGINFYHNFRIDKSPILTKVKELFNKKVNNFEVKEIDLKEIFGGLK